LYLITRLIGPLQLDLSLALHPVPMFVPALAPDAAGPSRVHVLIQVLDRPVALAGLTLTCALNRLER
jgi:hypothetical protein